MSTMRKHRWTVPRMLPSARLSRTYSANRSACPAFRSKIPTSPIRIGPRSTTTTTAKRAVPTPPVRYFPQHAVDAAR